MNVYVMCGNLLRKVDKKEQNFKNAFFELKQANDKIPMRVFKQIYAITLNCIKKLPILKEAFPWTMQAIKRQMNATDQSEFEIKQRYCFFILEYEMFYSRNKKIKGGGYLPGLIKKNKEQIKDILNRFELKYNKDFDFDVQENRLVNDTISLRIRGYKQSEKEDVIEDLKDLYEGDEKLTFDKEIPNLIIMKYTKYSKLQATKNEFIGKHIVVQTKSSCLPAYVLLEPLLRKCLGKRIKTDKPVEVLDCCAAPGNKTMQLADYLGEVFENFKLFANDKSFKRFQILEKRLEQNLDPKIRAKVQCINEDFLKLDPNSPEYKNIRYILLDPSCSGSGMLTSSKLSGMYSLLENSFKKTPDYTTVIRNQYNALQQKEQRNLKSCKKQQARLLRHAARFPNVQRIVYSTCSIYEQENEFVVRTFLQSQECKAGNFKLGTAMKKYNQRGFVLGGVDYKKTVRVNPIEEKSDGFFVALFTRKKK